jgi:hypothetical protein
MASCITGNRSSAFIHLPQSKNAKQPCQLLYWYILKLYCKPCLMHECLAGKCETLLGPIMCPGWPSEICPYRMTGVRWEPIPPSLVRCHNSSVPWIAVAQSCGSLICSHSSTPSISTSLFFNYPTRKSISILFISNHNTKNKRVTKHPKEQICAWFLYSIGFQCVILR